MTNLRQRLGKLGEDIAAQELLRRGYRVIKRNYRSRLGEIDIIAEQQETLVFVEVKAKTDISFGLPQENVGRRKQAKIRKVAQCYLAETDQFHRAISFCVAAVQLDRDGNILQMEIIEDAF
ncbi:MAG: YraN family protein [Bacillota bacterium]|jgi:putative endonuclease